MLIKFDKIQEVNVSHTNYGQGTLSAKIFIEPENKIMIRRLPAGASAGMHQHITNSEINYVLSGTGKAVCEGWEEELTCGVCQYCRKGTSHNIINTGSEDLVLFTVVPEQ